MWNECCQRSACSSQVSLQGSEIVTYRIKFTAKHSDRHVLTFCRMHQPVRIYITHDQKLHARSSNLSPKTICFQTDLEPRSSSRTFLSFFPTCCSLQDNKSKLHSVHLHVHLYWSSHATLVPGNQSLHDCHCLLRRPRG